MKNAIWSAVPNLSVIVAGNPIAMVLSVATQVGTAYMNYRREKANAGIEKENSEFELQITAMEQFHALQRELFTTAWRLADSYGFKDEWRLTENQIKQYDQVLMDADEYRKYARLEAIAPNLKHTRHSGISMRTRHYIFRKMKPTQWQKRSIATVQRTTLKNIIN